VLRHNCVRLEYTYRQKRMYFVRRLAQPRRHGCDLDVLLSGVLLLELFHLGGDLGVRLIDRKLMRILRLGGWDFFGGYFLLFRNYLL